jgi:hypothetical protein
MALPRLRFPKTPTNRFLLIYAYNCELFPFDNYSTDFHALSHVLFVMEETKRNQFAMHQTELNRLFG